MRTTTLLALIALLAAVPAAQAQQTRGGHDQQGQWSANDSPNGGYQNGNSGYDNGNSGYDNGNRQRYPYSDQNGAHGSYDRDRAGGYDRTGSWMGPNNWVFQWRGRSETLDVAAGNFALAAAAMDRETYRQAGYADRGALAALRRLDQQAQVFSQTVAQRSSPRVIGHVYADLIAIFGDAQRRFGALEPDERLSNQFLVMAANLGRLDQRFFGDRGFSGNNPGRLPFGHDRDRYDNSYSRPDHGRDGRDTSPYPYGH